MSGGWVLVATGLVAMAGCQTEVGPSPLAVDTFRLEADSARSTWPELRFTVRRSVAWMDSSRLALIDGDRSQVLILDLGGQVHRIGRKGEGPGEFTAPLDLIRTDGGGFLVLDLSRRGFHEFDADGRFIRLRSSLGTPAWPVGLRGDTLLALDQRWGGGLPLRRTLVAIGETHPTSLLHLDSLDPELGMIDDAGTPVPGDLALQPDGGLIVVNFRSYRILWLDRAGKVQREGGRDLPPLEPPSDAELEERRKQAADIERKLGERQMADQMRRAADEDARRPIDPIRQIRSDDQGRLWVLTARREQRKSWFDLFDHDGDLVAVVGVSGEVLRFSVFAGRLATLEVAPDGDPEVDVVLRTYRLPLATLRATEPPPPASMP